MKIVDIPGGQGSPAWIQYRLSHFGSSEAAAMLGLSPYTTRSELLRLKHSGVPAEFSEWFQRNVLDKGHAVEAAVRPIIEDQIADTLYPVICEADDGVRSASCDGLDMDGALAWECKQWNEALAADVSFGRVPDTHMPQCQHILQVTGAKRLLFSVSDGTPNKLVSTEVLPDPEWFKRLDAGWAQFAEDLKNYTPPAAEQPKPIGKTPETLPALRIEVTGAVTASNLVAFKEHALEVFRGISTDLQTDQDFADAEKAVKWCGDVEDRLKAAKEHALSQTESIDALFRAIDQIANEARDKRLTLDKKIKARKDEIRGEIVAEAQAALEAHRAALNERLGTPWLARVVGPFGDAMKGKKTVASCRDAVSTALANAKIEMSAHADRLEINRKSLVQDAVDWFFLFADFAQVGNAPAEMFKAVAEKRIRDHLEADAARKAKEAAAAPAPAPAPVVQPAIAPRPAVASSAPTIKLGEINARLAPIQIDAAGLALLGFNPVGTERAAKLYRADDFSAMCRAMRTHLGLLFEEVPA